ncbi:hypothetical protein EKO04_006676 [Ascochyta lentis]|uniref:Uncharacterized protein n=1 Tax=Ascochyta lentis TaxID=205686 RepID=A0A8H7J1L0_9PLEO|nr:hypothetical protein EKO04_006676 [Ascochyta lentis]
MQFYTSLILLALGVSVQAECYIAGARGTVGDKGCCWGGEAGSDACLRQTGSASCLQDGNVQSSNFCMNNGIPNTKCNADCCDIATGLGQPCPKSKNRCDAESGCPYRSFPGGKLL